ncbi:MAG: peptide ABC transporter substrate-binding protein [Candidatus Promineifilaceae bacterium]
MNRKNFLFCVVLGMGLLLVLAACRDGSADSGSTAVSPTVTASAAEASTETAVGTAVPTVESIATLTAVPEPTATPYPPKKLIVCLAQEPASLYPYSDASLAATAVRHAIYENLYTTLGYDMQPVGLVAIPTLENGGIQVAETAVNTGDTIVDAQGAVVTLKKGVELVNAAGERVTFDGETAVTMPQLIVEYTFQPMQWSDGTPVTAADSVFSFQAAADPSAQLGRAKVNRTASYVDVDEHSVRWTGVPGFVDVSVMDYVWPPLPLHQLRQSALSVLSTMPEVQRMPLSNGPFIIDEWLPGEQITLTPNPYYYRADEGLPRLDEVVFRFLPADYDRTNPLAQPMWQDGTCDLLTQDIFYVESLPSLENVTDAVVQSVPGPVFEQVTFGVNSYGVYGDGRERPDWFDMVAVRQALTMCTNRQAMVDTLLYGRSFVMDSYVPDNHPLYPGDLVTWPYDPAAGRQMLDEAGYLDSDGDGVREDPVSGRPFRVSLLVDNGNTVRRPAAEQIQQDLAGCGVAVEVLVVNPVELYADGPAGTVFGRSFDMAQFAWLSGVTPPCHLWLGRNITGPREEGFGGWGNINPTGWQNEAFDAACETAVSTLSDGETAVTNHQAAMRIFAEELPAMPLFAYPKVAVARPYVQNLLLDSAQLSELWNLAAMDIEQ